MQRAKSRRTQRLLALAGALLVLAVAAEFAARWVLTRKVGAWAVSFPEKVDDGPHPRLGWVASETKSTRDKYGPGRHKTYNAQGMRATTPYPVEAPDGVYRVICVGDSYTFGTGLGDDETYPERMEQRRPSLETINMAMGAYGVDQAVLWYEHDGAPLEHELVLLAFTDNAYERMPVDALLWVMPKPRFLLSSAGELVLDNVPVPSWGRRGYWRDFPRSTNAYKVGHRLLDERFVQADYDAFAVAEKLYRRVAEAAKAKGRHVVLVHLPTPRQLQVRCPDGEGFCRSPGRAEIAVRLEAIAGAIGVPFVDATPPFRAVQDTGKIDPYFQPDLKYSVKGAALVADHLVAELSRKVPGFPAAPPPPAAPAHGADDAASEPASP